MYRARQVSLNRTVAVKMILTGQLASSKFVERFQVEASNARILNDTQKAIESYQNLARVSPEDPDIQFSLGGLYESANDLDNARAHYAKTLEQDPETKDKS